MAKERSIFTEVAEELKEEIRQARLDSGVADSIPFGFERVPRQRFVQSLKRMTEAERKMWLDQVGQEQAIAMLRGRDAS